MIRVLLVLALSFISFSASAAWQGIFTKTQMYTSQSAMRQECAEKYDTDPSYSNHEIWTGWRINTYGGWTGGNKFVGCDFFKNDNGSICPAGQIWDQSQIKCVIPEPEQDPCEDKQGQITGYMNSQSYLGCIGGCSVSSYGTSMILNDGTHSSRYQYSGSSCSGSGGGGEDDPEPPSAPDENGATPEPEIPPTKEAEEEKTNPDTGETTTTTETTKDYKTDNNGQIGDVNERTTTTTTTHSDGSTTTTTTTHRTETVGGVKSTSSTETRVTCDVQQNCSTTITGQGNSTEKLPGEEEGEEGSVSGGETCDSPPQCDGDVFQCAAILQAYKLRCDGNFEVPDDFDGDYRIDLAQKLLSKTDEFHQVFNDLKSQANSKLGLTLNGGGSIMANVQEVKGVQVDFSFARFASELSIFGQMIIAICSLVALRIVLE